MVRGIESFREWFRGYEDKYAIIGGTACDLLMTDEGLDFRATKDIDLVLIVEAVDAAFGRRFWEYIVRGNYEHRNKSTGEQEFYRFSSPSSRAYPAMIELFTRKPDSIELPEEAVLSPLPLDENISSLSAILLAIYDEQSDPSGQYDPDQGARIHPFDVTDKVANQFFMLFCRGRKDVYELRHTNPKTGRTGYYTQCFNRWDPQCHKQRKDNVRCKDCEIQAYKPLNYHLIKAHMEGKDPYGNDVIAIYPMVDGNMCQLLVFDFDNHAAGAAQTDYANADDAWKNEVDALRRICRNLEIDCAVERSRSGNGAHLWIFFKEMVTAKLARKFGFALLDKGAESVNLKSFKYYDRMIPTQNVLPKGGLGNVIALPLQGQALKNGNSAFVDEAWNAYPDQLKFLGGIKRLSKTELEETLWKWTGRENVDLKAVENGDEDPWDRNAGFSKNDVSGKVKLVISDRLYVDASDISNRMKRDIRKMATFPNRQYFQNLAILRN